VARRGTAQNAVLLRLSVCGHVTAVIIVGGGILGISISIFTLIFAGIAATGFTRQRCLVHLFIRNLVPAVGAFGATHHPASHAK
jgi:hypothetical protein